MDINQTLAGTSSHVGKSLENPPRPKAAFERAAAIDQLARIVVALPAVLCGVEGTAFPLLTALRAFDEAFHLDLAKRLVCLAAVLHPDADERRTAEYLLRNRSIASGDPSGVARLLYAARYAAEMDMRRLRTFEVPTPPERMWSLLDPPHDETVDDPSVGTMVLLKLALILGRLTTPQVRQRLELGIVVALELGHRHLLRGATNPSLLSMRSSARRDARLVTHLRRELDDPDAAPWLSRLLIGPDGTSIETSLLWWATMRDLRPNDVPDEVQRRWHHCLDQLEAMTWPATPEQGEQPALLGVSP